MALTITQRTRSRIALGSGVLLVLALGAAQFAAPVGTVWRDVALVVASVLAGFPIAVRAWAALRAKAFSIDLLVTIAVIGALVIGEYVESAVVSFLFLFGAWLEARSLERTSASLRELVDLAPTRATVVRDGERVTVDADDVEVGETVIVTSGERIAVDGIVASGTASVTEASITGESVPVRKEPGTAFAGTVAEAGYLEVEADHVGDETTFARIIELVEEAQESRTPRQRLPRALRPVLHARHHRRGHRPRLDAGPCLRTDLPRHRLPRCPRHLSVPVAAVAGLGNIARHGVLVKDGEALENLTSVDTLVLDKTGTLTVGRPVVTSVHTLGDSPSRSCSASRPRWSRHRSTTGRAIVAEAQSRRMPLSSDLSDVEVVPGLGLQARVDSHVVTAGRAGLLTERGVATTAHALEKATQLEQQGA